MMGAATVDRRGIPTGTGDPSSVADRASRSLGAGEPSTRSGSSTLGVMDGCDTPPKKGMFHPLADGGSDNSRTAPQ